MDVLANLLEIEKYDKKNIKTVIKGERYLLVENKNGNIGVAAVLGEDISQVNISSPNLDKIGDRIFFTAYLNSIFNREEKNFSDGDLLEVIDFHKYSNIVMIGYFKPVIEKMEAKGLKVSVFDLRDDVNSLPMAKQKEYLQKANAVILSATSIFNGTFDDIVSNTQGDTFILGPTSILDEKFFEYKTVKGIFGSVFKPNDIRVKKAVTEGWGTRQFLKFGRKVSLLKIGK